MPNRWRFVGFFTGQSTYVDEKGETIPGGQKIEIHSLFERGDGLRRVSTEGRELYSQNATHVRAKVKAWERGGPLPELDYGAGNFLPEPDRRPKAKLIPIDGGKGAA